MTTPFTLVPPIPIDSGNLSSSTILENDFPEFDSGVTYLVTQKVIYGHNIYESLTNANIGRLPDQSPDVWLKLGPTNRFAAFDETTGTFSQALQSFTFTVLGNNVNTMAFLEVEAASIRVVAFSPSAGTYYDTTHFIQDYAVIENWLDYFYTPVQLRPDLLVRDIPSIPNSTYTITVSATPDSGAMVKLGTFVMGRGETLGMSQYGARASIIDYSRKEQNDFGQTSLVKRRFSKRMDIDVLLSNNAIDSVSRRLSDLRSTPVLWIGAGEGFDLLIVYGFYRDWSIAVTYARQSLCTLQIEGLV